MAAVESFSNLIGINLKKLSKNEILILEAELFVRICEKLKEIYRNQYKDYFHILKFNITMENDMIDSNFIRCVINDILSTETYTLEGLALYTQTPEDVLYEIAMGANTCPTLILSYKLIEIHRSVRAELYQEIIKKVAE
jgi:hypothetical protein